MISFSLKPSDLKNFRKTHFRRCFKSIFSATALVLVLLAFAYPARANNIQTNNVTLTGLNTTAGLNNAANFSLVQFDLTWSNSWRTNAFNNWDAAWVFVKFRLGSIDYLSAPGARNSGNNIYVHTTAGLRIGMPVFITTGASTGVFQTGTLITAITSDTSFTVNTAPTTTLSADAVVRAERIWEHAWLHNTGHNKGSLGASASLQVGLQREDTAFHATLNPALGAFFYRASNGSGTFSSTGAQLRWNYGAQGIKDNDFVELKVYAVEMVYVPQGNHGIDRDGFVESVLIKGDGANNSTSIVDSSVNARVVTRVGTPVISTAQSPFAGGSSISFNGSTDYLTVPANADFDFGSGNFTIETRIRPDAASVTGIRTILSIDGDYSYSRNGCHLLLSGGVVYFDIYVGTYTANGSYSVTARVGGGSALLANTWYHVALSRVGNDFKLFINGVQQGATTTWAGSIPGGYTPRFGYTTPWSCIAGPCGNTAFLPFAGFMKDIRIVKGIGFYNANFTPPASSPNATPNIFPITSENGLTLGGTNASNLTYLTSPSVADDFNSGTTQNLPGSYPKGFNGFYCMKTEITQQQWVNFYNCLTTVQDSARDLTSASGKNSDALTFRNNISWTTGDATLSGGTYGAVSCNFLNWADGCAYADWSGLRPMTELEYEKAARGSATPMRGEISSGYLYNTAVAAAGFTNAGASTEIPSNATANAIFNNVLGGPMRSGALATASSSRLKSGGSFWGALDLSGNLSEQVVNFGTADGRTFTGRHGDGKLSDLGYADISTWPGFSSGTVITGAGSGTRGGNWTSTNTNLMISSRSTANTPNNTRTNSTGFRAVRILPTTAAQ